MRLEVSAELSSEVLILLFTLSQLRLYWKFPEPAVSTWPVLPQLVVGAKRKLFSVGAQIPELCKANAWY